MTLFYFDCCTIDVITCFKNVFFPLKNQYWSSGDSFMGYTDKLSMSATRILLDLLSNNKNSYRVTAAESELKN